MLAQNFKTPADLKINDAEFDALVKVLGMLERGEIANLPMQAKFVGEGHSENLRYFDMARIANQYDCGTAGCILGWMHHINPRLETEGSTIIDLFLPRGPAIQCRDTAKAAIALRNYLTFGEPRWAEALAE